VEADISLVQEREVAKKAGLPEEKMLKTLLINPAQPKSEQFQ
jgi:prolyl-tRNA editing enzyme YbaK/EbsC (Cys-tRNA(Pro) deacylase)